MNEKSMGGTGAGSRQILRDEIGEFFEDFTEQYRGRPVVVEQQGRQGGARVVADKQPLQALSYQAGDRQFDIRIVLGKSAGETFAHVIPDVQSVDLDMGQDGAAEVLRIQARDGTTSVRLR